DIVFPGRKKVIFIHGCFWHGHQCNKGQPPKSNLPYWLPKLERNIARDDQNMKSILALGWKAIIIWQCEIKNKDNLAEKIKCFLNE
ncbi:MAG: very short patch repair endonuclease, partial [Bdellovibrionia bacterium]